MKAPMDEIISLAQDYKVAPPGKESEAALAKLCTAIERLVASMAYPSDPEAQRTKAFFGR